LFDPTDLENLELTFIVYGNLQTLLAVYKAEKKLGNYSGWINEIQIVSYILGLKATGQPSHSIEMVE
jgi:hypothetical protein